MAANCPTCGAGVDDPFPGVKVLVATPNYLNLFPSESHQNHVECAVEWTRLGIDFKMLTIGRTFVHFARTQACQVAIMAGFTHIFWLDDDAIIDPALLPKYLRADRDVMITPYFMRRAPFECGVLVSTNGNFHDHASYRNLTTADLHQGVIEVDGGGTHAMLIKTRVLKKRGDPQSPDALDPELKEMLDRLSADDRKLIDHSVGSLPDERLSLEEEDEQGIRSYFVMPKSGTEDMLFCYRLKRKGVKIHCDTDASAGHVGFAPVITEAFRAQAEAVLAQEKGTHPPAVMSEEPTSPTRVMRVKPNDITAGTASKGVSSARHEAIDMSKASSLL